MQINSRKHSQHQGKGHTGLVQFKSRRLLLKQMEPGDVTQLYVEWLNDPEVNRFLEVRFSPQSREQVEEYIRKSLAFESRTLHLGVFDEGGSRLVGTVTFHNMDEHHRSASISFVIGHPKAKGKGYGSEAVHAATHYMFTTGGFFKLWGGYYDGHVASEKVFVKNGYKLEGRLIEKLVDYRGERVDHVFMGHLARDFRPDSALLEPTE